MDFCRKSDLGYKTTSIMNGHIFSTKGIKSHYFFLEHMTNVRK